MSEKPGEDSSVHEERVGYSAVTFLSLSSQFNEKVIPAGVL